MRFLETDLDGARLIAPEPAQDERGSFSRTFCVREFADHGLEANFVQHSLSCSARRGTVRGMHFQKAPHGEVKVVECARGAIWDAIIDLRPHSPTFRRWQAFELNDENRRLLYVPEGFAHGFQTLSDDAEVRYLISAFYEPSAASGLRYDDPAFGISWPLPVTSMSPKDKLWPDYAPQSV